MTKVDDKRLAQIKYQAEHNIRNMSSPEEILALTTELIDLRDRVKRLNTQLNDADYMKYAYYNMLGPKGREVVKMLEEKRVSRVHFDWGPDAFKDFDGEGRAQFILDVETSPKQEVKWVDDEAVPIDDWLVNNHPPTLGTTPPFPIPKPVEDSMSTAIKEGLR